jgi:hypothetical protein
MRALTLLVSLLFAALLMAGCQGASELPTSKLLHNPAPATCEPDLRDAPCLSCLKTRCCALAQVCPGGCKCAVECAFSNNTKACAAACATPQERALAECMASSCDCPGGRP